MPKITFRPRMRHVFMAILGTAVLISTVGSILEVLRFDDGSSSKTTASATVGPKAFFETLTLETPSQPDAATKASDGGSPVAIVKGLDLSISAQVQGVREVRVVAGTGPKDAAAKVIAKPDARGHVSINLRLPQANTVYVIQAYGIINDKLIPNWEGGRFDDRPAVTADTPIRVMAE